MPPKRPHVVLFDLYAGGHHGQYLRQLVDYWAAHAERGRLSVAASARLVQSHPEVAAAVEAAPAGRADLLPLDEPVRFYEQDRWGLVRTDLEHGRQAHKLIRRVRPDHLLFAYADHVQLSLALGLRGLGATRLSGIYFRPSFHYPDLAEASAAEEGGGLGRLAKQVRLWAALRNPHLQTLFSLDPFAVPAIEQLTNATTVVPLADGIEPMEATAPVEAVRKQFQIEPGRRLVFMFGALSERKGVLALLDAMARLPETAAQRTTLVLAGQADASIRARMYVKIQEARLARPVQINVEDYFLPQYALHNLMHAADVIALPYQRHVGSSGVLVRAAAAGKPVVSDGYGLLGALVRRHRLGLALDATDPGALADGLARSVTAEPEALFDRAAAAAFAQTHTAERFARTLFDRIAPAAFAEMPSAASEPTPTASDA